MASITQRSGSYRVRIFRKNDKPISKSFSSEPEAIHMFNGAHTRGRKPNGYVKYDLNKSEQLLLAIKATKNKKEVYLTLKHTKKYSKTNR
jgi:hypothetical protein